MPNSTQEEKYRWIKPILDEEITIKDMAKVCPFSERALKYWLAVGGQMKPYHPKRIMQDTYWTL